MNVKLQLYQRRILTFINITFSLFHKFANEQDGGSCSVPTNIILCNCSPCNHNCGWILDLLQIEESFQFPVPQE